ncbi:MAG: ribosome-associated translation inhibitor RaiA [Pseudomonadota bacterium]
MQLNIAGKHLDLTDALKKHVEEQFHLLSEHFDKIGHVRVVLEVLNPHTHRAECTINMVPAHPIHVSADSHDMYSAITEMTRKANRLVIAHKEQMRNHRG